MLNYQRVNFSTTEACPASPTRAKCGFEGWNGDLASTLQLVCRHLSTILPLTSPKKHLMVVTSGSFHWKCFWILLIFWAPPFSTNLLVLPGSERNQDLARGGAAVTQWSSWCTSVVTNTAEYYPSTYYRMVPPSYKLVYKPHENYSYIYHKP